MVNFFPSLNWKPNCGNVNFKLDSVWSLSFSYYFAFGMFEPLFQVAEGTKHLPHLWDLCSNEIVVRSAKHILKVNVLCHFRISSSSVLPEKSLFNGCLSNHVMLGW